MKINLGNFLKNMEPGDVIQGAVTPKFLRELCPEDTQCYEVDQLLDLLEIANSLGGSAAAEFFAFEQEMFRIEDELDFVNMSEYTEKDKEILRDALEKLGTVGEFITDLDDMEDLDA